MNTAETKTFSEGKVITHADVYSGSLLLISARYPLKNNDPPMCAPAFQDFPHIRLQPRAASCLYQLVKAADGIGRIIPVSGCRSFAEQSQIYRNSLAENGTAFTKSFVAAPGCSEHQSGLAADLAEAAPVIDFIRPEFPDSGVCANLRNLAPAYGFVQRYTEEKKHITGIACEPWHFRYVGYPHSELMVQKNLCLEEYIGYLKQFTQSRPLILLRGGRQIRIFCAKPGDAVVCSDREIAEVSGTNTDCCIVTVWK